MPESISDRRLRRAHTHSGYSRWVKRGHGKQDSDGITHRLLRRSSGRGPRWVRERWHRFDEQRLRPLGTGNREHFGWTAHGAASTRQL
jgi:hypothetical protein